MRKLFVLFVIFGYLALMRAFALNYFADLNYERSQKLLTQSDVLGSLKFANASIKLNPMEPNYYKGRARVLIAATYSASGDKKKALKDTALNDLQMAYSLNPSNLVTIRNIIPLYYYLAVEDLSSPQGNAKVDEAFVPITQNFYSKVQNISPNDVGVYALLAKYEKRLNFNEEYNYALVKINNLRPDLLEWNENLK